MSLKDKIARLFGRGKQEKHTFVIFFKHSQRTIEFESTWEEINSLSTYFGGERGFKMDNFFVPWSEVAGVYEKSPEEKEKEEKALRAGAMFSGIPGVLLPVTREQGAKTAKDIKDIKDTKIDETKVASEEEKI